MDSSRSLLANMVEGVSKSFEKALLIKGIGYRVKKTGDKLLLLIALFPSCRDRANSGDRA